MRGQALVVGISFAAVALSCLVHEAAAQPQQGIQPGQTQQGAQQVQPEGGMMGGRMVGGGMMGRQDRGAIGAGMMMRMMFSLMDADGDGSISLQEFQAAHERMLTMEEMQSFMGAGMGR